METTRGEEHEDTEGAEERKDAEVGEVSSDRGEPRPQNRSHEVSVMENSSGERTSLQEGGATMRTHSM